MLRKTGLILSCALLSLSLSSYATTIHRLHEGITLEYDLPPNDPQVFVNYMFWRVESTCKIFMEADGAILRAEVLAKKGKINNLPLVAGESMEIDFHSGDILKFSADSGAKVQITNMSSHNVHATCGS